MDEIVIVRKSPAGGFVVTVNGKEIRNVVDIGLSYNQRSRRFEFRCDSHDREGRTAIIVLHKFTFRMEQP